jgi:hypothetical protein
MVNFDSPVTGYRLVKDGEVQQPQEEVILEDVKLPDDSPARVKCLKAGGKKWYLTVTYHPDSEQPFALFCQTNHVDKSAPTSDAITRLESLALRKGIPSEHVSKVIEKCEHDNNVSKLTRMISLLLRHGVLIKNIVLELDKMEDVFVGSFLFQIKKFLSSYIKNGEEVKGETCANCQSTKLVYSEGCLMCLDCGSSKCS